ARIFLRGNSRADASAGGGGFEEARDRQAGGGGGGLRGRQGVCCAGAGRACECAEAFATRRRLALAVAGIPVRQPDVKEERKGPKVGAPEQAIAGFLRAAGLSSIDQVKVQADKKGDFYVAVTEKAGRPAIDVIAGIVPEVVRAFPWPKSMR